MENKIFPYAVIYKGVFYPANTPIKAKEKEQEVETPKEDKKPKKGGAKK